MRWKTGELIAPTVEYTADAAKDFHSHDTTINTVCALPLVAFLFVNLFFEGPLFASTRAQLTCSRCEAGAPLKSAAYDRSRIVVGSRDSQLPCGENTAQGS